MTRIINSSEKTSKSEIKRISSGTRKSQVTQNCEEQVLGLQIKGQGHKRVSKY